MQKDPPTPEEPLLYKRVVSTLSVKRLVVTALLFWIPVITVIAIADEVLENEPIAGDSAALLWLRQFQSSQLDSIMIFLTDTAGPLQMVVVAAVLIFGLYVGKRRRAATFLLFSLGGASVINFVLKLIFARDRPDLWTTVVTEASYSFPSGHTMGSAALAFSIIVLLWDTRWRYVALATGLLFTFTIGITRMYLGVHYPSDVVAGWLISLVWVLAVKIVLDHYKTASKQLRTALRIN